MIPYLLKVSLCWVVFYLLYFTLFSKTTFFRWNRAYLLGSLLLGFLLPTVDLSFLAPTVPLAGAAQEPYLLPAVQVGWSTLEARTLEAVTVTAGKPLNWPLTIYLAGAGTALLLFLKSLLYLGKLYRHGEKRRWKGRTVVLTDQIASPFSFLHFIFWDSRTPLTAPGTQDMFAHEDAHIRQGHTLDVLITEICQIVFWFNPFIHLYRTSLRNVHEYLADAAVLNQTSVGRYGRLLLGLGDQLTAPIPVANHFFHSQLKKRIVMMTKQPSQLSAAWRYGLLLPIAFFLALFFNQQELLAQDNRSQKAATQVAAGDQAALEIDHFPRFPGCEDQDLSKTELQKCSMDKLIGYISNELKYPEAAKKNRVQGTVIAGFTVDTDGSVSNVEIKRGIGSGCDEEVQRILTGMPRWIPGAKDGKPQKMSMTLPVAFRLPAAEAQTPDQTPAGEEEVFMTVEQMPLFPGCEDSDLEGEALFNCSMGKLIQYIGQNLRYPEAAKTGNIQGTNIVEFIVEKDGSLSNIKVIRNIGGGTAEEVIRVMNAMPLWQPGLQRGQTVRVKLRLPVAFKLGDNVKSSAQPVEEPEKATSLTEAGSEEVFLVVEEMPRFPGCEDSNLSAEEKQQCSIQKLMTFIGKNINYPQAARENRIEGTTVVEFIVEKDGSITNQQVIRGIGGDTEAEVLRIIEEMPIWIPGVQRGRKVRVKMRLPVKFKLGETQTTDQFDLFRISNTLEVQDFSATPNPSTDGQFDLRFQLGAGATDLTVLNKAGQVVFNRSFQHQDGFFTDRIDLSRFAKDTYFIRIKQGDKVFTETLVIQ